MAWKWLARLSLMAILTSGSALGCGDEGAGGPKSYVGQDESVMVEASEGGLVAIGAVHLDIPAGALAADTEITVAVRDKRSHPNADSIALDVYEFGPDGTTFLEPVSLEFDLAGVKLDNAKAEIAWLDDSGKWNKLADSAVQDGKITATTTHFTPFTVILTLNRDGKVVQTGGQCGAAFTPCGGDITGTWKYTGACLTLADGTFSGSGGGTNPYAACDVQPTAALTLDLTGSATFGADGHFSVNQSSTMTVEVSIPNACLEKIGMGKITCESFQGTAAGKDCVLAQEPETSMNMSSGTYTTSGSKLVITETNADAGAGSGATDSEKVEYCVKGNGLSVRVTAAQGAVMHYTATRQ